MLTKIDISCANVGPALAKRRAGGDLEGAAIGVACAPPSGVVAGDTLRQVLETTLPGAASANPQPIRARMRRATHQPLTGPA